MEQRLPSGVGLSSTFTAVNANNATCSFKKGVVGIAGLVVVPVEGRWAGGDITVILHVFALEVH